MGERPKKKPKVVSQPVEILSMLIGLGPVATPWREA